MNISSRTCLSLRRLLAALGLAALAGCQSPPPAVVGHASTPAAEEPAAEQLAAEEPAADAGPVVDFSDWNGPPERRPAAP